MSCMRRPDQKDRAAAILPVADQSLPVLPQRDFVAMHSLAKVVCPQWWKKGGASSCHAVPCTKPEPPVAAPDKLQLCDANGKTLQEIVHVQDNDLNRRVGTVPKIGRGCSSPPSSPVSSPAAALLRDAFSSADSIKTRYSHLPPTPPLLYFDCLSCYEQLMLSRVLFAQDADHY